MSPAPPPFEPERLEIIAALERWHFWFVARRSLIGRLLERTPLPPNPVILDVGCGTGSLASELGGSGTRVLALDLRPEGLRHLRSANVPVWAVRASATALPIARESVDAVLALDVLEHTDDAASLREVVRVLKPGGSLLVTVPALPALWSARDEAAGHMRRYTRRGLVEVVRHAGLEPLDVRFYQCLLLPMVAATRFAGRRFTSAQRAEERPGGFVNRACLAINRFEVSTSGLIRWPWGTSLAALAWKPAP